MDIKQEANEILVTHKNGILASFIGILLLLAVIMYAGARYDKSSPVGAPPTPPERKLAGQK